MNFDDAINLAYPLAWPDNTPRTPMDKRERARFEEKPLGYARDCLVSELRRLGSSYVVISTNLPVRNDGLPYASAREPDDTGVCAWFDLDGVQKSMACDRWVRLVDNVWALAKTIEAMRGIERWGTSEILKRAFQAFGALPPAPSERTADWRDVFVLPGYLRTNGVPKSVLAGFVKDAYRALAQKAHPDHGGSDEEMQRLNAAYEAAKLELRF